MLILGLIIGFIAGTISGIMTVSFCIVVKTNDDYAMRYNKEREQDDKI